MKILGKLQLSSRQSLTTYSNISCLNHFIVKPFDRMQARKLRKKQKHTLALGSGSHRGKHVLQVSNKLDNNHCENSDSHEGMIHEQIYEQTGLICPLKSLQKYLSQLNPKQESLCKGPTKASKN